jgi:hypothetical protein
MVENSTKCAPDNNYDVMDLDGQVSRFDCFSSSLTSVSGGAYESMTSDKSINSLIY